ncbi:NAD-dependent isocitrate dehydrogenase [Acetobacter fabarum]|jgi:isocitrate dehydrogenase (NAD+)|uniref:Isocitrate dehydrogenase n=1 Tax=Acetobacter fabarum TaxID=483199 RepID=A0A269Y1J9_9PROT|nr:MULTISPECIES: isocitrate/isopropylmalate family dehydrogenase [Acetobacter]MDN6713026.1 isocitrate/isopropylmalate family dehydrogenase [Acetobacter sp.]MCH4026848.1 isocitrate/isopropylmalate family dehydrogenase [Acetobacter fabarum]MCH4055020.1 isocitrate/isopropylmalate family dehydrogenase [Acetobacter fabarum]MCH4085291.1 isocitrate/isopropylmalate family dehydrogenase [Acetobacter fabarum]MCH4127164.1 isocitrate/isopropylmalate family dehydrogenase [Acetobacter fabarum]
MTAHSKTIPATLIPGDGIGPEIVESVIEILDAVDAPFVWDRQLAGMAGVDAVNDPLPKQTIESIRRTGLALKGPLTTPVGGGFKSINVTLRQEFGLFANLRPTKTIVPGGRFEDIDLVLFRENLEGYYAAMEHYIPVGEDPKGIALSSGFTSRAECRRIVKYAFDYAVKNNRKTVTIVHKANILKLLTGLFLEEGRKVAEEYKGRIAFNERIVDACAMQLVINPWQFDVVVTTNLFGDILSDLTAGLVGGLGMAPGANIGEKAAVFEAVHGSAPDIAGKGIANPLALLLAAVMMLRHVGHDKQADRIDAAIKKVITEGGVRTKDLGGNATSKELTAALKQGLA